MNFGIHTNTRRHDTIKKDDKAGKSFKENHS
jgi:hypothetical protein